MSLLRPADLPPGGTWADLGAGAGAFTLALRELVGQEAEIYAVDKEQASLGELSRAFRARFDGVDRLHTVRADFSRALPPMPALDGAVMANSLHFFGNKLSVLQAVRERLKSGGRLLVVEYNVDAGNMWVPYPVSYEGLRPLLAGAGFSEPKLLGTHPSRFLKEIYSAQAKRLG